MNIGVTATGEITLEAHGKAGVARRVFPNVVLNEGWQRLLSRNDDADGAMVPRWLHFGTSSQETDASQPGLIARDSSTTREAVSVSYGGFTDSGQLRAYSEAVVRFDYAPGEMTGEWAELGLSYDQDYAEPYNRALVRDDSLSATPLLVLSDQALTVYVRLRLSLNGWGQSVPITGGLNGIISMKGAIGRADECMWLKGLPITRAEMGGASSRVESEDRSVPSVKHYFSIGAGVWSASGIDFYGRDDAHFFSVDFQPAFIKQENAELTARITMSLAKQE